MESIQSLSPFANRVSSTGVYRNLQVWEHLAVMWKMWSPVWPFTAVTTLCHSDSKGRWTLWDARQSPLEGFGHSHHTQHTPLKASEQPIQTHSFKTYLWGHHDLIRTHTHTHGRSIKGSHQHYVDSVSINIKFSIRTWIHNTFSNSPVALPLKPSQPSLQPLRCVVVHTMNNNIQLNIASKYMILN